MFRSDKTQDRLFRLTASHRRKKIETREAPERSPREERQDHQEENVGGEMGDGKMDQHIHR